MTGIAGYDMMRTKGASPNCGERVRRVKRKTAIFLGTMLLAGLLAGCGSPAKQEPAKALAVYSFCGENEQFSIANGVLVLTAEQDVLYGGDLKGKAGVLPELTSYSTTYFLRLDEGERTLLSNSATDLTGGTMRADGSLGSISGDVIPADISEGWQDKLWFVLEGTGADGAPVEYSVPLTVTEVT